MSWISRNSLVFTSCSTESLRLHFYQPKGFLTSPYESNWLLMTLYVIYTAVEIQIGKGEDMGNQTTDLPIMNRSLALKISQTL